MTADSKHARTEGVPAVPLVDGVAPRVKLDLWIPLRLDHAAYLARHVEAHVGQVGQDPHRGLPPARV